MFSHRLVEFTENFTRRCDCAKFFENFQIKADTGSNLMNVSCAKSDEEIAGFKGVAYDVVGGVDVG